MGKFDLKDTEQIKDKVVNATHRGPGYFFKNALLIILIFLGCYIFTNPDIIMNPRSFFENFDRSSIFSVCVLAVIIMGIFQLGKSIMQENRETTDLKNIEKIKQDREEHNQEIIKRVHRNPEISMVLKDILINLNASRSTVCEMHNGTNTLAGVPFVHVSMTYEEISSEVQYSSEDYNCINMSRMPFISRHFEGGSWIGSTDEIEKEDKYLASKLKSNNDNYMAFALIHGKSSVLGVLTIAFTEKDKHPSKTEISRELMKASQKLSILLDK